MASRHDVAPDYHCGICPQSFKTKFDLKDHAKEHEDSAPSQYKCIICNWDFSDTLALEQHKVSTGHGAMDFSCDNCGKMFSSARALSNHNKPPSDCTSDLLQSPSGGSPPLPAGLNICNRCSSVFRSRRELNAHRSFPRTCSDAFNISDKHTQGSSEDSHEDQLSTPADFSQAYPSTRLFNGRSGPDGVKMLESGDIHCNACTKTFKSPASYSMHLLSCRVNHSWPQETSATEELFQSTVMYKNKHKNKNKDKDKMKGSNLSLKPKQKVQPPQHTQQPLQRNTPNQNQPLLQPVLAVKASPANLVDSPAFICNIKGCVMQFRSQPALKVHQQDAHGVGGQRIDVYGEDAWILNQRVREDYKREGLLRSTPSGSLSRRGNRGGFGARQSSAPAPRTIRPPLQGPGTMPQTRPVHPPNRLRGPVPQALVHHAPVRGPPSRPVHDMGGPEESEQAQHIHGKILRLLIQADIFVQHYGKVTIGDINWTRISVTRQTDAAAAFEDMCHLPKYLQHEYLPSPKTFARDYTAQYLATEFQSAPRSSSSSPALRAVAIACSRVLLADGREDIVKIAAVDVTTCRILMSHFVCTDPTAHVVDWRSSETGLRGWSDLEYARENKYKIFKGWKAVRSAFWKFIDKDTIVIGHNLRAELDALRMVHGRAVDIAKVAEKAAGGPLGKLQLGLDTLVKDCTKIQVKKDVKHGRDVLLDVLSARELGLWIIKNKEEFETIMRGKASAYANHRSAESRP